MEKHLKHILPVVIWAELMYILSSIPYLHSGFACDFLLRKAAHVSVYLILTLLLYRAFRGLKMPLLMSGLGGFVYPAGVSSLYAMSDEIHQLFVAGRVGSVRDVFIDTVGIFSVYIAVRFFPILKDSLI